MYWKNLSQKSESYFQRKTGIKKNTFLEMVKLVKATIKSRPTKRGKVPKYNVENQILIMLHYYREYPTFFHLGDIYNIHESTAQRIVVKIEDILIKSGKFSLPKRSELHQLKQEDIVIIDVTETPIERPKKNKENTILAKRKSIH